MQTYSYSDWYNSSYSCPDSCSHSNKLIRFGFEAANPKPAKPILIGFWFGFMFLFWFWLVVELEFDDWFCAFAFDEATGDTVAGLGNAITVEVTGDDFDFSSVFDIAKIFGLCSKTKAKRFKTKGSVPKQKPSDMFWTKATISEVAFRIEEQFGEKM